MSETTILRLPATAEEEVYETGSVMFIGTATTLIRHRGFTILTDPNFLHAGDHAHLGFGISSRRLTNPAVEIGDLPPLDLCVLSHYHGDHWDKVASDQLPKDLPIITTIHAAAELKREGFENTYPLSTWQSFLLRRGEEWLRISAMPGKHGPSVTNVALPPVMGSMLEWGNAKEGLKFRLYITGDTLLQNELKEIPRRYPDIDLALLHLGGTRVFGVLVTMDAKQGVQLIHIVRPRHAVPIHYNDYEVFKSPLEDFMRAVDEAGLSHKVHYLHHGDTLSFDQLRE